MFLMIIAQIRGVLSLYYCTFIIITLPIFIQTLYVILFVSVFAENPAISVWVNFETIPTQPLKAVGKITDT